MDRSDLPFEFSHEVRAGVLVQDITGWDGTPEHTDVFAPVWEDHATSPEVTGGVTLFGPDIDLGTETQEHFAEVWGPYADEVGIERLAFVADGIKSRAISANVETTDCDIEAFNDQDEAFEWASPAGQG